MWVTLSLMYWSHIRHMTRHEFLSIFHWTYHAPPRRRYNFKNEMQNDEKVDYENNFAKMTKKKIARKGF